MSSSCDEVIVSSHIYVGIAMVHQLVLLQIRKNSPCARLEYRGIKDNFGLNETCTQEFHEQYGHFGYGLFLILYWSFQMTQDLSRLVPVAEKAVFQIKW